MPLSLKSKLPLWFGLFSAFIALVWVIVGIYLLLNCDLLGYILGGTGFLASLPKGPFICGTWVGSWWFYSIDRFGFYIDAALDGLIQGMPAAILIFCIPPIVAFSIGYTFGWIIIKKQDRRTN